LTARAPASGMRPPTAAAGFSRKDDAHRNTPTSPAGQAFDLRRWLATTAVRWHQSGAPVPQIALRLGMPLGAAARLVGEARP
jgi:hypothetical protein